MAAGLLLGIAADAYLRPAMWVAPVVFAIAATAYAASFARLGESAAQAAAGGAGAPLPSRPVVSGTALLVRICGAALLAAAVGMLLHFGAQRYVPPSSIERFLTPERQLVRLNAVVLDEPRLHDNDDYAFAAWSFAGPSTTFLCRAESFTTEHGIVPASGLVRVTVGEAVLDLRRDERVELFGMLSPLRPPQNPGGVDWRAYYHRQGIRASMHCERMENVRRLGATAAGPLDRAARAIRARVHGWLVGDLASGPAEETSLLEAMILGHRSRLDQRLNEIFIRSGCIHYLAVSGVHVVIVLALTRMACRMLLLRRRTALWIMVAVTILYAVIAEPRPPILRASVFALFFLLAQLTGRGRAHLNWISATVVVLALIDPAMIFDVGYQLSTVAVLGVSYLTPPIAALPAAAHRFWLVRVRHRPFAEQDAALAAMQDFEGMTLSWLRRGGRWLLRWLGSAAAVSVAAWVATAPIILLHFHRVQPWAALNSLVAMLLVTAVMFLGFAKLLTSAVLPSVGALVAGPLLHLDRLLIALVDRLALLPHAELWLPAPGPWTIGAYYVGLVALCWLARPAAHRRAETGDFVTTSAPAHRLRPAALVTAGVLALSAGCVMFLDRPAPAGLRVTVLAVGMGSATVIQAPDGTSVLFDAGSNRPYDVGSSIVVPFLRAAGVSRLDRIYVSHANLDHYAGIPTIVGEIPSGPVWMMPHFQLAAAGSDAAARFLELLDEANRPVQVLRDDEQVWELGGVRFERLWVPDPNDDTLRANDTSLVLRVSHQGRSILLTGDIEERALAALLQRGDLHADVLILPHHGDVEPSTRAFVQAVAPSAVVRSSNQRLSETTNGLDDVVAGIPMYNTAEHGAVTITIDHGVVTVAGHVRP